MHANTARLIAINVIGGTAVLGSYAYCIAFHPELSSRAWGGVPEGLKSFYIASMLFAAAGYFPFTAFLLLRLDPRRDRIGGPFRTRHLAWLYTAVLAPSALWMPLTLVMLTSPGPILWTAIRLTLFTVGLGSLGILAVLLAARPRQSGWAFRLAVAGSLAFCLQTAVLDALVWPAYFPS
jgi:hypothetical protein